MRRCKLLSSPRTHKVINQSIPFEGYNGYTCNPRLMESVNHYNGQWGSDVLQAHGARTGSKENLRLAILANENPPTFKPFDRYGNRIDSVEYHDAYHELMRVGLTSKVASFAWENQGKEGAHAIRGALMYMQYQLESGTSCPITMTFACVPSLLAEPTAGHYTEWVRKASCGGYDPRDIPVPQKTAVTLGMSMTEKQGGSDVRTNTTTATEQPDGSFSIVGHKFFTSAPHCDGFLTLAYSSEKELSCFLIPRWKPDGTRNEGLMFQRLKNKLGDRSNASSEVEYHGAYGTLIGPRGKGVKTIVKMVNHTRMECALGSSALTSIATRHAVHHAAHRHAFGSLLIDKPLMRSVLSELCLESEGVTALALRVAASFDTAEKESATNRIITAIGKYYICKRCPNAVYEALESHGGIGYVEEFPLARMYRQAPLNSIWEGSGNVSALDVLRAFATDPATIPSLLKEINAGCSKSPLLEAPIQNFQTLLKKLSKLEAGQQERYARHITEYAATLLTCSALLQCGPKEIADTYAQWTLGRNGFGLYYGAGLPSIDRDVETMLLERHKTVCS